MPADLQIQAHLEGPATVLIRWLGDRRVVWVEFDAGEDGAVLSSITSSIFEVAAVTALEQRLPLVLVLSSMGADIDEGLPALHGWGRLAAALARCSGSCPDDRDRRRTRGVGPGVAARARRPDGDDDAELRVRQRPGDGRAVHRRPDLDRGARRFRQPGPPRGRAERRSSPTGRRRSRWSRSCSPTSPTTSIRNPPRWPTDDPADRPCPEAGELIPASSTGSYDVRKVAEAIVDEDSLLELRVAWAANIVTAFATIDGRPVGIVANQPMSLAGTLDIPASQKAARFVAFCDAFNVPLITFVDTPGFYPGKDLEWRGMIRHGAQLVFAYAEATVPRICVILRKSYGGAFIVMDSKTMGNDMCLAWPWAELAVMGAGQAAAILQRRATPEEREAFEADYAERLLNPYVAAERGYVDAVIEPAETRAEIAAALAMLEDKREELRRRKHGNTPLCEHRSGGCRQ